MKTAKLKNSYDALIFGGGLSGLLAAKILEKKGKSYLIIEPSEHLGGRLSGWSANDHLIPSNLNLYSHTEPNLVYFSWLEKVLEQDILSGMFQTSAKHFQDGSFKDFNGFGDRAPLSLFQLNKFCFENEKIKISSLPQNWISKLTEELPEDRFILNSEITKINLEKNESISEQKNPAKEAFKRTTMAGGKAISAEINGKTDVSFEHIIWTVSPHKILDATSAEALGFSETKKLKKRSGVFDSILLNLAHEDYDFGQLNMDSVFCLYGSNQDFEPLVGFISKDHSCWMTLIDTEKSLDHEFVSKVIKNMKKQIKRAFPELLEFPELKEKIILSESSYGQLDLKFTENGFLKAIPNLFFTSSLCSSSEEGLVGTLDRARTLDECL